ncbi:BTB/POZ protein [Penicillium sp. CMV-2018d]|nr:BTB/POZ protein [Penicillium sp. CMV-2018d]
MKDNAMSTSADIQDVMRDLFLRGQFSDMEIICQGITFKAHRAIVCTQSREYDDIDSSSPGDKENDTESAKNIALNNMRVFITADKFGIVSLQSLATQKFSKWAAENWKSPVFPEVIQEVMESVPSYESSLQEVVVDIIYTHIVNLIEDTGIIEVLNSFGCLGSQVIARLVRNGWLRHPGEYNIFEGLAKNIGSRHSCRNCSRLFNARIERGKFIKGMLCCAACGVRY